MDPVGSVRIDKWLWCVRLYRSRSLAAAACHSGKVQVNGQTAKPSRALRCGDVITASMSELTRTVKVIGIIEGRVGAKLVPQLLEDLTPPSEYQKQRERPVTPAGFRPKGAGRPTKRDRRILDSFFD